MEIGMYQDGDVQLRSRFTEMDMRDCDRDASRWRCATEIKMHHDGDEQMRSRRIKMDVHN